MESIDSIVTLVVEAPFWTFVIACIIGGGVIAFILWYGFFIIALPLISLFSTIRKAMRNRHHHLVSNPQLGLTMADGGEKIEEGNKGGNIDGDQ
ncbi:MAG: hypothetical protein SVW57_02305 [Thermodesulfobacteriota bacterium]|nr:hypothetical protein [Thermodesulfobacteriota bacterium]